MRCQEQKCCAECFRSRSGVIGRQKGGPQINLVVHEMRRRSVLAWGARGGCGYLRSLCQGGRLEEAIAILKEEEGVSSKVDSKTWLLLLQACTRSRDLDRARQLHAYMAASRAMPSFGLALSNTLLHAYAASGGLGEAWELFWSMGARNSVSWTVMIGGCARSGQGEKALHLFRSMAEAGGDLYPDAVTCASALKACCLTGGAPSLRCGKLIHALAAGGGFLSNVFVSSSLIDMYFKCGGGIVEAVGVFRRMPSGTRNAVSWNAVIGGYAHNGHPEAALSLFQEMQASESGPAVIKPDRITFLAALTSCTDLSTLNHGKTTHARASDCALDARSDEYLGSALLHMYAKCGSLHHAQHIFNIMPNPNAVTWTTLIAAYTHHNRSQQALELFEQSNRNGITPDNVTFSSALLACTHLATLPGGKWVHALIIKNGLPTETFIANSLIDMYVKCSELDQACRLFDRMPKRDSVSWNTMIAGYAQHNRPEETLNLFRSMQQSGVKPDEVTFATVLKACAGLAALEQGRQVHALIRQSGLESVVFVGNSLVDMYAKCGCIDIARQVFNAMPERNVVSWSTMIGGYGQHGHGEEALQLYEQMLGRGLKPDHVTFIGVLSACNYAGLVEEGRKHFDSMSRDHSITPTTEHYACIVNLLGRAGHLEEALNLIRKMPCEPPPVIWTGLLSACRIHNHMELARYASQRISEWESKSIVDTPL